MNGSLPPGFKIIDDAVSDCDLIIKWLEDRIHFEPSVVHGLGITTQRTSTTAGVPFFDFTNPQCIHEMNRVVWTEMDSYARQFAFAFTSVENVSIQRYMPGQRYEMHADASIGVPRVVSALVYLNTVEAGGETSFPHFDLRITPIQGRLVIFPSNYPYAHEALAPVSGVKYAAAFWAQG